MPNIDKLSVQMEYVIKTIDSIHEKSEKTLTQAQLTNGRVTKLEVDLANVKELTKLIPQHQTDISRVKLIGGLAATIFGAFVTFLFKRL